MEEFLNGIDNWEIIILLIMGVALLFVGYRIKKVAFFLIWFLVGFMLMTKLLPWLITMLPILGEQQLWSMLLPIAGGLLLALIGFSVEKICLAGVCFALVMMTTINYFGTELQTLAIGAIIGVVVAGAATMLMKPATIIATAWAGAYILMIGALKLIPGINPSVYYYPILIGLTLVGALVQFATTKRID